MNIFDLYETNILKNWSKINELMGKSNARTSIQSLNIDGVTYSEISDISNIMNDYFCSVAENLNSTLPTSEEYINLIDRCNHNFVLSPVSKAECSSIIARLKLTKNHVDTIPVKLFVSAREYLKYPVMKIINMSFLKAKFPDELKVGRVTPIFKKGDRSNPSNYRPICSLPFISKIFERIVTNRLLAYLNENCIISSVQFGFQKNKNTVDALIKLTETIYDSLNNKKHAIALFIDLRKAFDTVFHSVLLVKLEKYGVRGLPLLFFKSYLSGRKQFVMDRSVSSNVRDITIGVPQGSILGPILFLIYINDLPNLSQIVKPILFADDTTLLISNYDYNTLIIDLNLEIDKFIKLTCTNRVTINVEKTESLLFTNRKTNVGNQNILLGSDVLNSKIYCCFLGAYIESCLTFDNHIDMATEKFAKNTGMLYRISDCLPIPARLRFYHAFIYPYLTYNLIVWGSASKVHLSKLVV